MVDFSIQNFFELKEFIYEKVGLTFKKNKYFFFKRRVIEEIEKFNFQSFDQYFFYLKFKDFNEKVLRSLINRVTINETYFFREFDQLAVFAENLLPVYLKSKEQKNIFNLNILSAGCSIGAEPYTLSIILLEMLDNIDKWNPRIKGIDIDENALRHARNGIYNKYYLREAASYYIEKYFNRLDNGEFQIKDIVKKYVNFQRVNLIDYNLLKNIGKMDFIFCRNVLIYFDEKTRKKIVETFYLMLNNGGYLFLGHSESVARITSAFNMKRVNDFIVYYK